MKRKPSPIVITLYTIIALYIAAAVYAKVNGFI